MTKPRAAKPVVYFMNSYGELYKDLFPEVRAYEYFKYLLLVGLGGNRATVYHCFNALP